MRSQLRIGIPKFMEKQPTAYNPAGSAARAIFLRDVAIAWQKAGDQDTASKMQRDADNQVQRLVSADTT